MCFQIEELKAALSNIEYRIITECASSNVSETPNIVPPLNNGSVTPSIDEARPQTSQYQDAAENGAQNGDSWITLKVSVFVNLVELCLYTGMASDTSLATVQVLTCRFFPVEQCWVLIPNENAM